MRAQMLILLKATTSETTKRVLRPPAILQNFEQYLQMVSLKPISLLIVSYYI